MAHRLDPPWCWPSLYATGAWKKLLFECNHTTTVMCSFWSHFSAYPKHHNINSIFVTNVSGGENSQNVRNFPHALPDTMANKTSALSLRCLHNILYYKTSNPHCCIVTISTSYWWYRNISRGYVQLHSRILMNKMKMCWN